VRNLEAYASLRMLARQMGVAAIDRKRDEISVKFTANAQVDPSKLARFVASNRGAQFTPAGVLKFAARTSPASELLDRLHKVLGGIASEPEMAAK